MPRCPHCDEEIRLKLSMKAVFELVTSFYKVQEEILERMPRVARNMFRKRLEKMEGKPLVTSLLACAACDRIISASLYVTPS